jgi:tetratricopeptide (TPR) repeat protein
MQYFKANIAYRTGRNEEALLAMKSLESKKGFYREIIYHYMMGKILLNKLDHEAGYHLKQYLSRLEKQEYLKEINYKLAVYSLINGDEEKYKSYCEIVLDDGIDVNERDRESLYDADLDYTPHQELMKARLLLSGGYLVQFDSVFKKIEIDNDGILAHRLEFFFLKAKYELALNHQDEAIKYFQRVLEIDDRSDYYFASDAALKLGYIYQNMEKKEKAKEYYELSLKLFDSDYYEYIENDAEKALAGMEE